MPTRILAVLLLAVLLTLGNVGRADEVRIDGNWWNTQTRGSKLIYLLGFFDGQISAQNIFDGALLIAAADPKTRKYNPERARVLAQAEELALSSLRHDYGNVNAGQLTDGLDKVYVDFRNARIRVQQAVIVVVRSIDGTPDEDVQKLLERKRSDASKEATGSQ